jgi:hypothetical protein
VDDSSVDVSWGHVEATVLAEIERAGPEFKTADDVKQFLACAAERNRKVA